MIEWNRDKTYDNNRECHVLRAHFAEQTIVVRISEEAMEDVGDEKALKAVAERKILAGLVNGRPPKHVLVTNADVRR